MKQNAKQRRALSSNDFAIPPQGARRGRYPIPDQAHAVEALARVDADGTPEEKRKVHAAVRKRYPDLPSSHSDPRPDANRADARPDARQADARADANRADARPDARQADARADANRADVRSDANRVDVRSGVSHADAR